MAALFDSHAATYRDAVESSVGFSGRDLAFFTTAKAFQLRAAASDLRVSFAEASVLDVGCGAGALDSLLTPDVRSVTGVDVSEAMVEQARMANPGGTYLHYDGEVLPFDDQSFDLAFAVCVVHHVDPAQWYDFQAEIWRVVRPGGAAVIIEHNPLNPLTRRSVSSCEFDADAVLTRPRRLQKTFRQLGASPVRTRYMLFSPLASMRVRSAERTLLGWLPLGAQYSVEARKG